MVQFFIGFNTPCSVFFFCGSKYSPQKLFFQKSSIFESSLLWVPIFQKHILLLVLLLFIYKFRDMYIFLELLSTWNDIPHKTDDIALLVTHHNPQCLLRYFHNTHQFLCSSSQNKNVHEQKLKNEINLHRHSHKHLLQLTTIKKSSIGKKHRSLLIMIFNGISSGMKNKQTNQNTATFQHGFHSYIPGLTQLRNLSTP